MAETAYFFDGTTVGNSTLAPYSELEVSQFFSLITTGVLSTGTGQDGFVLPDYDNDLEVISADPTVGNIIVSTGYAIVNGYLYQNTAAVSVAIPSPAANPRWDRIVLRPDVAANTVRITRVPGAEAANPSIPAIAVGDLELCRVWVPGTYNAAADVVAYANLHDQRTFRPIGSLNIKYPPPENLLPNSEWLAFSGNGGANPPDGWREVGATTTITVGLQGSGNCATGPRVRPLIVTANNGIGIATTIAIPKIESFPLTGTLGSRIISIRGTWRTGGAGQVVRLTVTPRTLGVGTGTAVTKELYRYSQDREFLVVLDLSETYDALDLEFTSRAAATTFTIGQVMVVLGYQIGGYTPKNEVLFFNDPIVDANWNNTAKSTGTTTVNLATAFAATGAGYIRGAIFLSRGNDSGSAATDPCQMQISYNGIVSGFPVSVAGIANDTKRSGITYAGIQPGDANAPVDVIVTASGAGTFDATIYLIGIIT